MLKRPGARGARRHSCYLDLEVDRLLTELESPGLLENTLVIITSDHGEQFGEHDLMSQETHLPSPARCPPDAAASGKGPQNLRVGTPVTLRDLPMTVLISLVFGYRDSRLFLGRALASEGPRGTGSPLLSALTWPNGDIAYAFGSVTTNTSIGFKEGRVV